MLTEVSFFAAFIAGLASFLAPCAVSLVPAYVSYISGVPLSELQSEGGVGKYRLRVLSSSLLYILGFSAVFVAIGASASALGMFITPQSRDLAIRIGGVLVIILGLSMLGVLKLPFLSKQRQFNLPVSLRKSKILAPILMGITFAAAWSPCVGQILGAILILAAASESVGIGSLLLAVYAAGLAIPFLLLSIFIGSAAAIITRLGPVISKIEIIGGVFLIILGVLLISGKFVLITAYFSRIFPGLAL